LETAKITSSELVEKLMHIPAVKEAMAIKDT
jgi:hypothetical protein